MELWHIGNTTVRSPYRLRNALRVLDESNLLGNLVGRENESAFAMLLHNADVLQADRIVRGDDGDYSDLGRKWRSALGQLGFLTTHFTRADRLPNFPEPDPILAGYVEGMELTGRPYEITPNGRRLIGADSLPGQQECFLRSLVAYQIPSIIETRYHSQPFSPLRFVIKVFFVLAAAGEEARISFSEMALFVQTRTPDDGVETVVENISQYRRERNAPGVRTRQYDRTAYLNAVRALFPNQTNTESKINTFNDYADLTFRYLRATGLFSNRGRGIIIAPERYELARLIKDREFTVLPTREYLQNLWRGASLPSDETLSAIQIVRNLENLLRQKGQEVTTPENIEQLSIADISQVRYRYEELLRDLNEEEYAKEQTTLFDEIVLYLDVIIKNRPLVTLPNGEEFRIPKGETPAYLEWIIWRAFLAINELVNKPYEARRFQIDQDFLPVNTAPGGGPDLIFEFYNAVIVVEVTLTSSSRQEATEGEPVRRHIAEYAEKYEGIKDVYGLFIAINIDSNTANTFKYGDWYRKDDSKINLQIVPMSLQDFRNLFASGKGKTNFAHHLFDVILKCRVQANNDAPIWKKKINEQILRKVNELSIIKNCSSDGN